MSTPTQTGAHGAFDEPYSLATDDAARFIGVSARTLQNWRTEGVGPRYVRLARNLVVYRRADLIDFLDQRVV